MTPGLHRGISAKDYHALDFVSSHRLGLLKKSPAHLRYELTNPSEPTPAMTLGTAIHAAILEPERFARDYVAAPECDRRTKEGKAIWLEFYEGAAEGKQILTRNEFDLCTSARDAFLEHDMAQALLTELEDRELVGIWKDADTGLTCKMLIDGYAPGLSNLTDLKTTQDGSKTAFEKAIFNFGYYRQAAMYLEGMKALGEPVKSFTLIALEKEPPHGIAIYKLDNEVIALGKRENVKLMRLYAACLEADSWPGYPEEVTDIGIPAWAINKIEEVIYG